MSSTAGAPYTPVKLVLLLGKQRLLGRLLDDAVARLGPALVTVEEAGEAGLADPAAADRGERRSGGSDIGAF
jgi:hypothetical protein